MLLPPLDVGDEKAMLALASPAVARTPVGTPGTVAPGVLAATGVTITVVDAAPDPCALLALTEQV
jgi:hypothetical protein